MFILINLTTGANILQNITVANIYLGNKEKPMNIL